MQVVVYFVLFGLIFHNVLMTCLKSMFTKWKMLSLSHFVLLWCFSCCFLLFIQKPREHCSNFVRSSKLIAYVLWTLNSLWTIPSKYSTLNLKLWTFLSPSNFLKNTCFPFPRVVFLLGSSKDPSSFNGFWRWGRRPTRCSAGLWPSICYRALWIRVYDLVG